MTPLQTAALVTLLARHSASVRRLAARVNAGIAVPGSIPRMELRHRDEVRALVAGFVGQVPAFTADVELDGVLLRAEALRMAYHVLDAGGLVPARTMALMIRNLANELGKKKGA